MNVKNAGLQINGRPLYINHYEMKQQRDLLNESNKFTPALSKVGQEGADVSFGEVVQCRHNPAGTPLAGGQKGWRR